VRVAIRVDASSLIGGGHVMRCLALADALAGRGAKVTFVTAAMPEALHDRIGKAGHGLVERPALPELDRTGPNWHEFPFDDWTQVQDATATEAGVGQVDWVIIDHYLLDARWHLAARRFADRILVIEDLANRQCDCDILVDQTFGRTARDYEGLVRADSKVLAGADYALLRPEFLRERPAALARRQELPRLRRVLISMGATDPAGITERVLDVARSVSLGCAFDVVLGAEAPSLPRLRQLAAMDSNIALHVNSDRMAELMRDADLAIGAAGTTSWERCCLGLPAAVLVLADNQRLIAGNLAAAGAHVAVDASDMPALRGAIADLLSSSKARIRMSEKAAEVVDGRGAERVLDAILASRRREPVHG
jgi:UDP-2,4-diacetamido-2,4,6-trideoxy-beta-L-altropyranose hydrolase